jgi:hypothetical protein
VTTRLCDSGTRCVTISLMILNRTIERYRIIDCVVKSHVKYLMSYGKMLNLSFIGLQLVPPLCDYKVWIDTERYAEVKRYLRNMVEINMGEEFCARRIAERKHVGYFVMKREMAREEYKEKREEQRIRKCEKARCVKEVYARGGDRALITCKWHRLTLQTLNH